VAASSTSVPSTRRTALPVKGRREMAPYFKMVEPPTKALVSLSQSVGESEMVVLAGPAGRAVTPRPWVRVGYGVVSTGRIRHSGFPSQRGALS